MNSSFKYENISTSAGFTNTSPASSTMKFPSRTDETAICSTIVIDAVLTVGGTLLAIVLFTLKNKLRKKSLPLVINMAFADMMLGAAS